MFYFLVYLFVLFVYFYVETLLRIFSFGTLIIIWILPLLVTSYVPFRSNKNNIIIFLYIITAMKITLKNARKTLRFVTAKEQVFSFRAVIFFFFFRYFDLFIYFYFFSQGGVNDYFHFFTCVLKYSVCCK